METPSRPLVVPQPKRTADLIMRDGAVIRLRQYGAGGRRLALSHGNGLAINAYLPFWQPLAENFELIVFDQRNHGENPLHDPASHDWDHIVADAREIAAGIDAHFGAKPTVGVFHSMSACVALMAALRFGSPWSALALFDPPLFPPTGHPLQPVELAEMKNLASRTRRRSQRFNSVEQFAVQLRRSPVFSSWVPGAHLLFAQSTLRKSGEEWILCNSSELEARIYETNDDASVWQNITSLPCPALLIGADPSYRYASAPASMCKAVHDERDVPYVMIPDTTHFLQMEKPEACRAALESFLATVS